jgi:formate dehydrogenase major subunit
MNALTREEGDALGAPAVPLQIDGQQVLARPGQTLWALAKELGIAVPHLCHREGQAPEGNCRACVVEVQGERTLAASCCRAVSPGLVVQTASPRAQNAQRLVLELLLTDAPATSHKADNELQVWAEKLGVTGSRFMPTPAAERPASDTSHPAIAVNLDACIQCTRCVRACRDEQVNEVIGLAHRGAAAWAVASVCRPAPPARWHRPAAWRCKRLTRW